MFFQSSIVWQGVVLLQVYCVKIDAEFCSPNNFVMRSQVTQRFCLNLVILKVGFCGPHTRALDGGRSLNQKCFGFTFFSAIKFLCVGG